MKGCGKPIDAISDKDIEWLYKISQNGLTMSEDDLDRLLGDKNMPKEVKETVREAFPELKRRKRFGFV
jgi:hypothetical protein